MKRWEWWGWGGIAAMAALLAVAATVAWEPTPTAPPRAREFRDYTICLLTGAQGISADPGKAAFQGLQTVQDRTDVQVTYDPVVGEQTAAVAQQFLASQVIRRCAIVVALGDAPAAAVAADRNRYPQVKFLVLTGAESAGEITARVLPLVPSKG